MLQKWTDELLETVPKYKLQKSDGSTLAENVEIILTTKVLQNGTTVSAGNVNQIIDTINNMDLGEWL
ncbi:MAG: hypothetical protein RR322_03675 [Oscillospiraceae bacterium]